MQIKKSHVMNIGIFLLLYYIYLNPLKKIFIPGGSVTVAVILAVLLLIVLVVSKGRIAFSRYKSDALLCLSWFVIAVYIVLDNENILSNLFEDGMIQLLVMICVMLFITKYSGWVNVWINTSIFFVTIHALATIIFYFNPSLYTLYARLMFSGETLTAALRYYNQGYMSGLCEHFSTNGMYLSIGLIFFVERFSYCIRCRRTSNRNNKLALVFYVIGTILVFYALILSSKRMPLIAFGIAIICIYLLKNRKHLLRNLLVLCAVGIVIVVLYYWLVPNIPGLDTIVNKFIDLEDSDAGILNGRSGLWQIALDMFYSSPLFGQGFGSYSEVSSALDAITTSAHNYYLQLLAELGLIGLTLYIIAFLSALVLTVTLLLKISGSNHANKNELIMSLSISLGIQIFVLLYNVTATAMMYYYILIPYFLSCAASRTALHSQQGAYTYKQGAYTYKILKERRLCAQAF